MKDEGIFVLEWLAYHRLLGFDPILVVTNACRDGSDALLDRLADLGQVIHISQDVPSGRAPQDAGMDHVLRYCREQGLSHVLHIDSDEFVFFDQGDLAALRDRTSDADVVALPWHALGDSGIIEWHPGDLVLAKNIRSEPGPTPGETKFKSLFRVQSFARATDHNPLHPLVDDPLVVTPDGKPLRNGTLYQEKSARFRPTAVACNVNSARIFHYGIRASDAFLMKNMRGDGQANDNGKYRIGSDWHRAGNRNDVEETRMQSVLPALRQLLSQWREDPVVARLERRCQDWFRETRDQMYALDHAPYETGI
jgi:hypothetical protein